VGEGGLLAATLLLARGVGQDVDDVLGTIGDFGEGSFGTTFEGLDRGMASSAQERSLSHPALVELKVTEAVIVCGEGARGALQEFCCFTFLTGIGVPGRGAGPGAHGDATAFRQRQQPRVAQVESRFVPSQLLPVRTNALALAPRSRKLHVATLSIVGGAVGGIRRFLKSLRTVQAISGQTVHLLFRVPQGGTPPGTDKHTCAAESGQLARSAQWHGGGAGSLRPWHEFGSAIE